MRFWYFASLFLLAFCWLPFFSPSQGDLYRITISTVRLRFKSQSQSSTILDEGCKVNSPGGEAFRSLKWGLRHGYSAFKCFKRKDLGLENVAIFSIFWRVKYYSIHSPFLIVRLMSPQKVGRTCREIVWCCPARVIEVLRAKMAWFYGRPVALQWVPIVQG